MISKQKFIEGSFQNKVNTDVKTHPILVFLRKNNNMAFTVKEICKSTKMKKDAVRSMLRKLRKKNLVAHKSPYFMYK